MDMSVADALPKTAEKPHKPLTQRQEDARHTIAYFLLIAYIALLVVNVGVPVALFVMFHPTDALTMANTKDLILAISGSLGGLSGILGFVVGFYFKSVEQEKEG